MALIAICAATLATLAVGDLLPLEAARLVTVAGVSALGAALAWRKPAWRLLALATCAAALGAARASSVAADGAGPPAMIGSLAAPLADVRAAMESGVRRYLPEPQASLALGVLLGGSGHLDATMRLDLQRSGLAHLVAIDGLKQVVVAAALGGLSARLIGPSLGALPTLAGIAGYTLLTGGHPSAVRAGLMVGLATLASLTGRLADPLTSLLLAVTLIATAHPRVLLDVGLQLSLSATLGIVLLWPRLRRRLHRLPRCIVEPVGLTLAVTLATLPVMLSTFQVVSLVSPVAHIVALPLLSAVLITTALLAAASPLAPLGVMAGWLAWLPTTLLVLARRGGLDRATGAPGGARPGGGAAGLGSLRLARTARGAASSVAPPRCAVPLGRAGRVHRHAAGRACRAGAGQARRSAARRAAGACPRRGRLHSRPDGAHGPGGKGADRAAVTGRRGGRAPGGLGAQARRGGAARLELRAGARAGSGALPSR